MNAIFAVNSAGWFGDGDTMPWPHSKEDMNRFKKYTFGSTVVMGSKTWNSNMPKPLPGRRNIVLSRELVDSRCDVYRDITELLMNTKRDENIWVIGGTQVLWGLHRYIERAYVTTFLDTSVGDVSMDVDGYLGDFSLSSSEDFGDHKFEVWCRKK